MVTKHYLTSMINSVYMCICVYMYICLCVRGCVCVCVCVYTYGYILMCFSLTCPFIHSHIFFPRLPFSLIFVKTWGTTVKIRHVCSFFTIPYIVGAVDILSTVIFNFSFFTLTFQPVCFFVVYFVVVVVFLCSFNKFVIFQFYTVPFVLYLRHNTTDLLCCDITRCIINNSSAVLVVKIKTRSVTFFFQK